MFKKKSKYVLFITLIFLIIPSVLSGCARFDKTAYVQAALDSIYKGDHLKFSEITGTDIATLETNYSEAISAETGSFLNYIGIGDYADMVSADVKKEISYLLKQIYKHTSYSVGEQDSSGNIPVKLLPVSLYSLSGDKITAYMQDFFDKNDKGEFASLSDEEFYSRYAKGILDIVSGSLSSISYSNEVTVSVTITRDGTAYSISPESFAEIDKVILDYTM